MGRKVEVGSTCHHCGVPSKRNFASDYAFEGESSCEVTWGNGHESGHESGCALFFWEQIYFRGEEDGESVLDSG